MSNENVRPSWCGNTEVRRVTAAEAVVVARDLFERAVSHTYAIVDRSAVGVIVYRSEGQAAWARKNPSKLDRLGGAVRYVIDPPLPMDQVQRLRRYVTGGEAA